MTNAKLSANPHEAREAAEYDYRGEVLKGAEKFYLVVMLPVKCHTPDRTIAVEFFVRAEVPIEHIQGLEPKERLSAIAYALAKESGPRLAALSEWELYDRQYVHVGYERPFTPREKPEIVEVEITLNDSLASFLREATARHAETASAFERAKKYLKENVHSFRYDPSSARSAARFVTDCMRADASPYLYAWNHEKAAGILGIVEELIGRKNPAHPGYTSRVSRLESHLYKAHPPSMWSEYPPQAHLLSI